MEQPLNKIKRLSKSLPTKDSELAIKFIKSREFDKLLEIVESDIYLVQQNKLLDHPKEKFANINLEELIELKEALEEYISFLELPYNSGNEYWFYD